MAGFVTALHTEWSRGVGKDFEAFKGSRAMVDTARRQGVAGGNTSTSVDGAVQINIEKPGPDTRVKTDTSGDLFREVKLNRGRSMTMASQVA